MPFFICLISLEHHFLSAWKGFAMFSATEMLGGCFQLFVCLGIGGSVKNEASTSRENLLSVFHSSKSGVSFPLGLLLRFYPFL